MKPQNNKNDKIIRKIFVELLGKHIAISHNIYEVAP